MVKLFATIPNRHPRPNSRKVFIRTYCFFNMPASHRPSTLFKRSCKFITYRYITLLVRNTNASWPLSVGTINHALKDVMLTQASYIVYFTKVNTNKSWKKCTAQFMFILQHNYFFLFSNKIRKVNQDQIFCGSFTSSNIIYPLR